VGADRDSCGQVVAALAQDFFGGRTDNSRKRMPSQAKPRPCNKIIHARDYQFDASKSDPFDYGVYLRPFVFLYGKKHKQGWRAKLSIAEFVKWGAVVFLRIAGR
jgi:hypothetical protein